MTTAATKPGPRARDMRGRPHSKPPPITHPEAETIQVRLEALQPNPYQPRVVLDPAHIREIAESIAAVGLLQRPLVRPRWPNAERVNPDHYEIAFGHVRVEAIRLLREDGRWDWPMIPVDVRFLTDADMALIALSENAKRRDIKPIDQARAIRKALDEIDGLTETAVAETLGIGRSTLANQLRVLRLPSTVLDRVDSGDLSVHGAREFLALQGSEGHAHLDIMAEVLQEITDTRLGTTPDWRVDNIRRLIAEKVSDKLTATWRHLDITKEYQNGVHNAYAAEFDVQAFGQEFGDRIHLLPKDDIRYDTAAQGQRTVRTTVRTGSQAWTCAVKEWGKWQDAARKAQEATSSNGHEKPKRRPGDAGAELLQKALTKDPVANRLRREAAKAVPQETPETPGTEEPAPESSEPPDGPEEAQEQALQRRARPLTPAMVADLGTRAQVLDLSRYKGFVQKLRSGYGGIPFYFDTTACQTCIIGAAYGVDGHHDTEPGLVCINEEAFKVRLADEKTKGLAKWRRALEQADNLDAKRASDFYALLEDTALARPVAQCLLEAEYRPAMPEAGQISREDQAEFRYVPAALERVIKALGLRAGEDQWNAFSSGEARAKVTTAPEEAVRIVAANLLAYRLRVAETKRR